MYQLLTYAMLVRAFEKDGLDENQDYSLAKPFEEARKLESELDYQVIPKSSSPCSSGVDFDGAGHKSRKRVQGGLA